MEEGREAYDRERERESERERAREREQEQAMHSPHARSSCSWQRMERVYQSACGDELNEIGSPKGSPKHLHLDEFEAITEASAAGAGLALVELAWQLVGVETCAVTSRLRLAWPAHALENGHVDVRGYTRK